MARFEWRKRYSVLSVLFVAWIVAYMDRMVMSVALPYIAADFSLSPLESGFVLSAFFAGYALSQIPGGFLADRFGVRRVTVIALLWWSAFTAVTGSVGTILQMIIVRFAFGLGEGVFPGCAFKTIANWFPKRERATANALTLSSTALGAALAPLVVVGVMATWGWRAVFHTLFIPGLIVAAVFWIFVPNRPADKKNITNAELDEINDGATQGHGQNPSARLREVLKIPFVFRYFAVLFTFDIAYWGFSTWLPTYLIKARGFSLTEMGAAATLPFLAGAVGYGLSGWFSDRFCANHRRIPILASQLLSGLLLYIMFVTDSIWLLVLCQTLVGFILHVFFGAFWALPLNSIPVRLMGAASGTINLAGQMAAFITPIMIGYLVEISGGSFKLTFGFMIVSLLVSAGLVLLLPNRFDDRGEREA